MSAIDRAFAAAEVAFNKFRRRRTWNNFLAHRAAVNLYNALAWEKTLATGAMLPEMRSGYIR